MPKPNPNWPILTHHDQQHLTRIALPLGGIGAGTVALGGRGDLRDWEIVNRPAKGFSPRNSFFALWCKPASGDSVTRALEGVLEPPYEGARGAAIPNHGLPRFRQCSFDAAYPFGQVHLADVDVPLEVRIEAFNPLIPGDADRSSIPVAILRFVLINRSNEPISAAVCGSVENFIGYDGSAGAPKGNVNTFVGLAPSAAEVTRGQAGSLTYGGAQGVFMRSEGVDPAAEQWGTMALATTAADDVTYRTAWAKMGWSGGLLDFWDDFSADGRLDDRDAAGVDAPMASLAVRVEAPPASESAITFLLAWHFLNRQTWQDRHFPQAQARKAARKAEGQSGCGCAGGCCGNPDTVGNYYATQYADAWEAAARTAHDLPQLEAETLSFVHALCASDLPEVVKEAALYNLTGLRSQTAFRTQDGYLFGWEGCDDKAGCCPGSCTHVWNYEQATPFLFGALSCGMRESEFLHATDERGLMSFRINLPLEYGDEFGLAAADGQMGCIIKLYRDWQLCGDDGWLRKLWPQAKKALEFCWIPGGWDADRDGVMEGCQHNTMDVEYYGPNPQMTGWYLGALRAAEEMARHLGEASFADTCRDLFTRGSAWMDAHLFNGEYYEHEVRPARDIANIAPGLRLHMGAQNLDDPELQLGPGCLVDQLVGQYMAHVCGLGYLHDPAKARTTLQSILKYNWREGFYGHFNNMRSYVLNDESALLMGSYPRGGRPRFPFPYYNEVMTGFEYTAAIGMLYEGDVADGLKCIAAIRARYDGLRRSPFDEAECGHHYARAMAAWAAILALSGFHYSGVSKMISFAATAPSLMFWSNGYAWGTCRQTPSAAGIEFEIAVLHGELQVKKAALGEKQWESDHALALGAGETLKATAK
jgi:uncharacterized protein (DUF608 family)